MARNKSAIIVAGSRFNCYPRIDFAINIFGHRVSLVPPTLLLLLLLLLLFTVLFFHQFVRKMFYRPEKGSSFHSLLIIPCFYDCVLDERII